MPKNYKQGFILTTLYLVIVVFTILGIAFTSRSISEIRIAEREKKSIQSFYLAEAGIDLAIWELNNGGGTWSGWNTSGNPYTKTILASANGGLSTGDIDISITDPTSSTPQIDAIGYAPIKTASEGTRHIRTILQQSGSPAFDYTICAELNLELSDTATSIDGNLHSNGNMEIEDVNINGAGTAVGTISIEGGSFSEGYQEAASTVTLPTLDMWYYETNAGYNHSGDWTVSGTLTIADYSAVNGIIYVDGNFKADGATIVGPGTIVVTGTIKAENNAVIGSEDGMIGLFSNSNASGSTPAIKLETDSACYTIIFAPNGQAKIETTSSLTGSIVANDALVETGSGISYLASEGIVLPTGEGSSFSINSWDEQ